jgi:hypothetical protein
MSQDKINPEEGVPERQSHVASQMQGAAKIQKRRYELLGDLTECLNGLSIRISSVLRQEPEIVGSGGKDPVATEKDGGTLVDLAEELREINSQSLEQNVQIQDTISYVRNLTERVEL